MSSSNSFSIGPDGQRYVRLQSGDRIPLPADAFRFPASTDEYAYDDYDDDRVYEPWNRSVPSINDDIRSVIPSGNFGDVVKTSRFVPTGIPTTKTTHKSVPCGMEATVGQPDRIRWQKECRGIPGVDRECRYVQRVTPGSAKVQRYDCDQDETAVIEGYKVEERQGVDAFGYPLTQKKIVPEIVSASVVGRPHPAGRPFSAYTQEDVQQAALDAAAESVGPGYRRRRSASKPKSKSKSKPKPKSKSKRGGTEPKKTGGTEPKTAGDWYDGYGRTTRRPNFVRGDGQYGLADPYTDEDVVVLEEERRPHRSYAVAASDWQPSGRQSSYVTDDQGPWRSVPVDAVDSPSLVGWPSIGQRWSRLPPTIYVNDDGYGAPIDWFSSMPSLRTGFPFSAKSVPIDRTALRSYWRWLRSAIDGLSQSYPDLISAVSGINDTVGTMEAHILAALGRGLTTKITARDFPAGASSFASVMNPTLWSFLRPTVRTLVGPYGQVAYGSEFVLPARFLAVPSNRPSEADGQRAAALAALSDLFDAIQAAAADKFNNNKTAAPVTDAKRWPTVVVPPVPSSNPVNNTAPAAPFLGEANRNSLARRIALPPPPINNAAPAAPFLGEANRLSLARRIALPPSPINNAAAAGPSPAAIAAAGPPAPNAFVGRDFRNGGSNNRTGGAFTVRIVSPDDSTVLAVMDAEVLALLARIQSEQSMLVNTAAIVSQAGGTGSPMESITCAGPSAGIRSLNIAITRHLSDELRRYLSVLCRVDGSTAANGETFLPLKSISLPGSFGLPSVPLAAFPDLPASFVVETRPDRSVINRRQVVLAPPRVRRFVADDSFRNGGTSSPTKSNRLAG